MPTMRLALLIVGYIGTVAAIPLANAVVKDCRGADCPVFSRSPEETNKEHQDELAQAAIDVAAATDLANAQTDAAQIEGQIQDKVTTTEDGMITHQFYRKETVATKKNTPGLSCFSFASCEDCTAGGVCMWHMAQGQCKEDRDPDAVSHGTRFCASLKTEAQAMLDSVVPSANEHDDFQLFSHGKDPLGFAIASLDHGQDMYTVAKDQHNTGDAEMAEGFGGDIIDGASHNEYEAAVEVSEGGAASVSPPVVTVSSQPKTQ